MDLLGVFHMANKQKVSRKGKVPVDVMESALQVVEKEFHNKLKEMVKSGWIPVSIIYGRDSTVKATRQACQQFIMSGWDEKIYPGMKLRVMMFMESCVERWKGESHEEPEESSDETYNTVPF